MSNKLPSTNCLLPKSNHAVIEQNILRVNCLKLAWMAITRRFMMRFSSFLTTKLSAHCFSFMTHSDDFFNLLREPFTESEMVINDLKPNTTITTHFKFKTNTDFIKRSTGNYFFCVGWNNCFQYWEFIKNLQRRIFRSPVPKKAALI